MSEKPVTKKAKRPCPVCDGHPKPAGQPDKSPDPVDAWASKVIVNAGKELDKKIMGGEK